MAGKIYTYKSEEMLINSIKDNGFQINSLHKYVVLRLAINIALRLQYKPLSDQIWSDAVPSQGDNPRTGEYNMEQVTGIGKTDGTDYDNILRAIFTYKHKAENPNFGDDSEFNLAVQKYIRRGLKEIHAKYKSSDDFYQWLIDECGLLQNAPVVVQEAKDIKDKIEKFISGYDVQILGHSKAIRNDVYKIKFNSMNTVRKFKKDVDDLQMRFGLPTPAMCEDVIGEEMTAMLIIPRVQSDWYKFDIDDFRNDLQKAPNDMKICAYAGQDMSGEPFFFDLEKAPHIMIGGTTGGGKSVLLHNLINSINLLNNDCEFVLLDPKSGDEFGCYENMPTLSKLVDGKVITDMDQMETVFDKLVAEMEKRYDDKYDTPKIIVVCDEVENLLSNIKTIENNITKLAQKARAKSIHLILATQSPNSQTFSQAMRANFPSVIALRTKSVAQSRVILDEIGAEKLQGRGDMYIKLSSEDKKRRLLVPFIDKDRDINF